MIITLKNISSFKKEKLIEILSSNSYIISSTLRQEGRHTQNTKLLAKENLIINQYLNK